MRGPTWNFVQHLVEMTIAMFVGMFAIGMPAAMLWDALGWTVLDATVPKTLLMATYMTLGMSIWMLVRGCSWPAIGEMGLAMFIPFVMMYPFYWAGWVDGMAIMIVGHVLMVPAMIVAMLLRRDEYSRGSHWRRSAPVADDRELATQTEG